MTVVPVLPPPGSIVIIDDDDARRYSKSRLLRRAGFEVHEAATATEGLRVIRAVRPRLAIVDVGLPDMSGHEVSRIIRSDPVSASIPILQISATFVTEADTVASLDNGADTSLIEPIEPQVLIATVRALLRTRAAEEAMRDALGREQQARAAAEEASRIKDEFLAVLSHELRSPLGSILTWATLLRTGKVDAERHEQGLAAIERNARVQSKLVEDLLDVSRIISGKSVLETSLVDLATVVDAVHESLRAAADAKNIRIAVQIDPNVGPLLADPTRIQQVLWNLMSNAVKFSDRGGTVRVEVVGYDSRAVIRVSDDGRGIPAQFLPYVFERFRQADSSTTRTEGGLGLGLAIVRHIVEQHGGSVQAESEGEGRGSMFTVQLPLPAVRIPFDPAIPRERHRAPGVLEELGGLRVLIVDDEPDARDAVLAMLETCGAVVVAAATVATALDALNASAFDAVISDIGMPGQDGYSLIRRIRERDAAAGQHLAVIALSAYANTAEIQRMREAGFDASLTKPVDARDLVSELARVARLHGAPEAPAAG